MGNLCDLSPGSPSIFANTINGIIFNDSDYQIRYTISGTKTKVLKQTVSNDTNASAKVTANPLAIGGQATAGAKQDSKKQLEQEDTQADVWIKPHHFSTQGLLKISTEKQSFLSIAVCKVDEQGNPDDDDDLQANILITTAESICFIVTKDQACESLTKEEVEVLKKSFKEDYVMRKVYKGYARDKLGWYEGMQQTL